MLYQHELSTSKFIDTGEDYIVNAFENSVGLLAKEVV